MRGLARILVIAALGAGAATPAKSDATAPAELFAIAAKAADVQAAENDRNRADPGHRTLCELIEAAATDHVLPVEFFTRLIWAESSFRVTAVSPKGAQGIAQFMPGTAAERGLSDPFDPHQAIPASAHFLKDLKARFGNLGLAAAAYNAGPSRVAAWLDKRSRLPGETRRFVMRITGRDAEHWSAPPEPQDAGDAEPPSCLEVAALLSAPGGMEVAAPGFTGVTAPWGVQVAGHFSQTVALRQFERVRDRHGGVVGAIEPMVVRDSTRSRGRAAFYAVRLPAQSRDEASGICSQLRSAGGNCLVMRN